MRILVTGGAGFVGSNIALRLQKNYPKATIIAFDNLRRRGSELSIPRLKNAGIEFFHGDIRIPEDLESTGAADLIVEASAEPSVHAGYGQSPAYVLQTNLVGTINALEHARIHGSQIIFLSSSRIYPIDPIRSLPLTSTPTRLEITEGMDGHGWSKEGITEDFGLEGHRSMYGATKLASELLIEEYKQMYNLNAVVYRCGCLAGPWQMGKVDQGFVVLWASRHLYGGSLAYMGFGGTGLQVRDLLHIEDLGDLVMMQVGKQLQRTVYNVGGGHIGSVSLQEATRLCEERAGRSIGIGSVPETRSADIPWYITDSHRIQAETGWKPSRTNEDLFDDVFFWLKEHKDSLYGILGPNS